MWPSWWRSGSGRLWRLGDYNGIRSVSMTEEKRIPEAAAAANLSVVLDKVAQEHVPRYVVGADGEERGVIVNAAWFRVLAQKAEELDGMTAEPGYGQLQKLLVDARGRAAAYAGMLDRQADEMLAKACPRCQEVLGSKRARKSRADGVWGRLKVTLAEAAEGRNPPDQEVSVGIAGVGGDGSEAEEG